MELTSLASSIAATRQHVFQHSELITVSFFLTLALSCLDANLLVVLLKGRKVLACLTELPFFHTLADIPMHKGTLRVHQVELVVDTREDLGDCGRVTDHAASAHDLGQVATWDHG